MTIRKVLYFFGLGLCLAAFGAVFQEDPIKAWPMTPALIGTGITLFSSYQAQGKAELKVLQDIHKQLKELVDRRQ